jgi:hypothetical protein
MCLYVVNISIFRLQDTFSTSLEMTKMAIWKLLNIMNKCYIYIMANISLYIGRCQQLRETKIYKHQCIVSWTLRHYLPSDPHPFLLHRSLSEQHDKHDVTSSSSPSNGVWSRLPNTLAEQRYNICVKHNIK